MAVRGNCLNSAYGSDTNKALNQKTKGYLQYQWRELESNKRPRDLVRPTCLSGAHRVPSRLVFLNLSLVRRANLNPGGIMRSGTKAAPGQCRGRGSNTTRLQLKSEDLKAAGAVGLLQARCSEKKRAGKAGGSVIAGGMVTSALLPSHRDDEQTLDSSTTPRRASKNFDHRRFLDVIRFVAATVSALRSLCCKCALKLLARFSAARCNAALSSSCPAYSICIDRLCGAVRLESLVCLPRHPDHYAGERQPPRPSASIQRFAHISMYSFRLRAGPRANVDPCVIRDVSRLSSDFTVHLGPAPELPPAHVIQNHRAFAPGAGTLRRVPTGSPRPWQY
ncbi:hypothetical protein FB451DRAFT_1173078 [Mycena latifolia]|nr:hypothetical protein FB451DRAFT_1173078 [Mycena latifolia]